MDDLNQQLNSQEKVKSLFSVKKIIFIILGVVLLVEAVYAYRVLTAPTPPPPSAQKSAPVPETPGKISLTAPAVNISVKQLVPVAVVVDSGSHLVSGVDVIVRFDPKILEATPGGIIKGKAFGEYPVLSVDSKNGLISISGVSGLKNSFKGKVQFAVINLKAKTAGKTSLTVDFTKGSTADSNIVETATSKDILEQVVNLNLTVQ